MNPLDTALKVFRETWDGEVQEVLEAKGRYLKRDLDIHSEIIQHAFETTFGPEAPLPKCLTETPCQFKSGQIIEHVLYGYLGVIVEVDATFNGTDEWYDHMQCKAKGVEKDQPWYHVLVHGASHTTYVAQQNARAEKKKIDIQHPWVELFFKKNESGSYLRNERPFA